MEGAVAYGAVYQEERRRLLALWSADPNTRCYRCGTRARTWDPWEPDHVPPVAQGGTLADLHPAHTSCNRAAGARLRAQLRREKIERKAAERVAETYRYLEDVQSA